MNFKKMFQNAKAWGNDHKQLIFAVTAGCGIVATAASSLRAGIKANDVILRHKGEKDKLKAKMAADIITEEQYKKDALHEDLTFAKDMAVILAPSLIFAGVSFASLAAGYQVSVAKQAALTAAYTGSEIALKEFKEKAKEIVGEAKVTEIHDEIMKKHVDETPMPEKMKKRLSEFDEEDEDQENETYFHDQPWYDDWSGQFFLSSRSKIDRALLHAASKCQQEMSVSLNYIYQELDPKGEWIRTSTSGNRLGFRAEDLDKGEIPARITSYGPSNILYLEPDMIISK